MKLYVYIMYSIINLKDKLLKYKRYYLFNFIKGIFEKQEELIIRKIKLNILFKDLRLSPFSFSVIRERKSLEKFSLANT